MARVLIVDDTASLRTLMRITLERGFHQVVEAADGLQALDYLQTMQFDVVVVDVMMPGLGGFDLCRAVRAAPELSLRDLDIVVVSGDADETEATAAGADRFLPKPFTPSVLLNLVNELATSSQASGSSPGI